MRLAFVPVVTSALVVAAASAAQAPGAAVHVTAAGATAFNPMVGAFQGPATFELDGVPHAVFCTTYPLGMQPLPNGIVLAATSHHFDFGGGDTLTTMDHARLVPTGTPGVYALNSSLSIADGTGRFEGAEGHLHGLAGSTIDLVTGQAAWTMAGVVVVRP